MESKLIKGRTQEHRGSKGQWKTFSLGGVEGLLGVGELEGVDYKDKKHWLDDRMPETVWRQCSQRY